MHFLISLQLNYKVLLSQLSRCHYCVWHHKTQHLWEPETVVRGGQSPHWATQSHIPHLGPQVRQGRRATGHCTGRPAFCRNAWTEVFRDISQVWTEHWRVFLPDSQRHVPASSGRPHQVGGRMGWGQARVCSPAGNCASSRRRGGERRVLLVAGCWPDTWLIISGKTLLVAGCWPDTWLIISGKTLLVAGCWPDTWLIISSKTLLVAGCWLDTWLIISGKTDFCNILTWHFVNYQW